MTGPAAPQTFDWNAPPAGGGPARPSVSFNDETLRDGLQSPSARHPAVAERVRMLQLAAAVGVGCADVGLPGAGPRAAADVEALCRAIVSEGIPVVPNCAARTLESDIAPVLEISERLGRPVEIALFLASSPIRRRVEGWTLGELAARTERFVGFAVGRGLDVTFVAEDTTRSTPEDVRLFFGTAVRAGATRVCIADTAGDATPLGAFRLARFVRDLLAEAGAENVGLDWHGHNDRGMAVANALAAAAGGADRLHGTALGVGERVGNPPMEQLLVNARMLGWAEPDLRRLPEYAEHAARIVGVPIPVGAPVVGRDAFRTSTGVHAAAIAKAERTGDRGLVDLIYSSVPAAWLGRWQEIEVGPMSGASNVRAWLAAHGLPDDADVVGRILAAAKRSDRTLTEGEILGLAAVPRGR